MMARQRITTIYPRDVRALRALGSCGHLTAEQLREAGLRDKRIASYQKDGLIERVHFSRPGARDQVCYRTTAHGRDFISEHLSMRPYVAQSPVHDLGLAGRYFSLTQAERETWQTEAQCRDILAEHIRQLQDQGEEERARELWDRLSDGQLSMPDGIYTSEIGQVIGVEVITSNYGEAEIAAKEETAGALGAEIEFTRV